MFQGKRVAVTVPAYNEEALIGSVINGVPEYVDRIYIVNDGSTDGTQRIVSEICQHDGRFVLIHHPVNEGVGAAITTGYKKCLEDDMDIAVVMAGDNQMDPTQIQDLLAPLIEENAGYSKGNRMSCARHMNGMSLWRRFGNWLLKWLTRVSSGNYKVMDPQNGYAAVSAEALKSIDLDSVYPYYGYCNDLLAKFTVAGVQVVEVPMPARYQGEKSKIKYGAYAIRVGGLLLRNFGWRMRLKSASFGRRRAAANHEQDHVLPHLTLSPNRPRRESRH